MVLVGPLADTSKIPAVGPYLYIDGGVRFRTAARPGIAVGDGDSAGDVAVMDVPLPVRKSFSDFAHALTLVPEDVSELVLVGFLGGRRDHEWINLGELHRFLRGRVNVRVEFDNGDLFFSRGRFAFSALSTFSILCFESTLLSLTGACDYPVLAGTAFPALSSLGLSNRGFGSIELICDGPVMMILSVGQDNSK